MTLEEGSALPGGLGGKRLSGEVEKVGDRWETGGITRG